MGGNEVHGNEPLDEWKVAVLEDCTHLAGEVALAMVATELSAPACGAMMLSAVGANNVLCLSFSPTCLNDGLSACFLVIEVECHCHEAVEFTEIYHSL